VKIAIVHDYLNQYGGAERVVENLHEMYPDAPIFTTFYDPEAMPESFRSMDIRTSFMQKLPFLRRHFKKYLPLYPWAVESFDLRGFDVVLSSSSAFAKGARVPEGGVHVCYCYTPMRFVWDYGHYFERERIPLPWLLALPAVLRRLRAWDLETEKGVGRFVAISEHIRARIKRVYGRDAAVVYPPVDVGRFSPAGKPDDYYLVVSRLNAYKNLHLAVAACTRLGRRLLVVGQGPYEKALRGMAGKSVQFLGRVSDEELAPLMSRAAALIFPGEEDFGIAAMASGRPVIAYGRGGALETVVDGATGVFFQEPTVDSLAGALERLEKLSWDSAAIRRRAEKFDKSVFQRALGRLVMEAVGVSAPVLQK
jgi:glycosyltransferase involved in cell wall biosynthesis